MVGLLFWKQTKIDVRFCLIRTGVQRGFLSERKGKLRDAM